MTDEAGAEEVWVDKPEMWVDPDPDAHGMLLADRIRFYVDKVGLIDPFEKCNLKAASYGLRLGSLYFRAHDPSDERDECFRELREGEQLKIPPNSIVFVSTIEKLAIPHYMAATFNLKIDLIYKGLLLGTGPVVDPGFVGTLSCPLHNISNHDVCVQYGKRFAWIGFVKTTPFAERIDLDEVDRESDLYERERLRSLVGIGCNPLALFPVEKREKTNLRKYLPEWTVSSSLAQLRARLAKLEDSVNAQIREFSAQFENMRLWQRISVLAVAVLIVTVLLWGFALRSSVLSDLRNEVTRLRSSVPEVTSDVPRQADRTTGRDPGAGGDKDTQSAISENSGATVEKSSASESSRAPLDP